MAHTPDVRRVVAARFFSQTGSEAAFFVGIWGKAAFVLEATPYGLAGIMFSLGMSVVLGSALAGVLVDRFGPRRVLITAEWLFVPIALSVILADSLGALTLVVAVWAFASAPTLTAAASFAPYLTDDRSQLTRLNAWIEGASSLSFAAGPAIGAVIVHYLHIDWIFVLDAATSAIAALLVAGVVVTPPPASSAEGPRKAVADFIDGLRTVYGRRPLRYYVMAGTVLWLAFGSFGALEPLFFRDVVGTDIEGMSWMNAIFGLGFVTGAALLPRLPGWIVSARGLALVLGLTGLGTVLYVGWPDLRVIAVGAFVWSIFIGVLEPLLRTLLQRDSPLELIGRVQGVAEIHHRGGEMLPLAFAPALAGVFGVQATLIGGGLVATLVALASVGEAVAIDRAARERGVPEVEVEGIATSDKPISPLR